MKDTIKDIGADLESLLKSTIELEKGFFGYLTDHFSDQDLKGWIYISLKKLSEIEILCKNEIHYQERRKEYEE